MMHLYCLLPCFLHSGCFLCRWCLSYLAQSTNLSLWAKTSAWLASVAPASTVQCLVLYYLTWACLLLLHTSLCFTAYGDFSILHLTVSTGVWAPVDMKIKKGQDCCCTYPSSRSLDSSGSRGPLELVPIYLSSFTLPPSTLWPRHSDYCSNMAP